ncbi:hypothetical protein JTE90_004712 [Oedothorax gibbosus]|uniref:BHLH domain-containing protein n=1 Tax=Oedothorax gibbosus TaxID=931172 RepID=A0AAV6U228_9ARAC|nr:hypothetical protein JTE90_004712 [Oedothorax gibbosus]
MAFYHGNEIDRKDYRQHDDEDFRSSVYRIDSRSVSPRLDDEKKMRREIANSNERRRMQSINAGFQSLRALLPKGECDKLSKAAILQGTVEYVHQLQQEKSFLLSQNVKLTRSVHHSTDSDGSTSDLQPLPKRKRRKIDLDEGIGGSASPSSQSEGEGVERGLEVAQLRRQLEQERAWRLRLEQELREREALLMLQGGKDHDYTHHKFTLLKSEGDYLPPSPLTLQEHEISSAHHRLPSLQGEEPQQRPAVLATRPRQSLDTIVEAIRHVEGYHMFRDDDSPFSPPPLSPDSSPNADRQSFQNHVIISRAPVVQNRAGVIVSNTS